MEGQPAGLNTRTHRHIYTHRHIDTHRHMYACICSLPTKTLGQKGEREKKKCAETQKLMVGAAAGYKSICLSSYNIVSFFGRFLLNKVIFLILRLALVSVGNFWRLIKRLQLNFVRSNLLWVLYNGICFGVFRHNLIGISNFYFLRLFYKII